MRDRVAGLEPKSVGARISSIIIEQCDLMYSESKSMAISFESKAQREGAC